MQWPSSMRDNIRKHFSIRLLTLAATLRLLCHHAAVAKMDLWSPTKNSRSLWTSDTFCFYTLYVYVLCTTIQRLNQKQINRYVVFLRWWFWWTMKIDQAFNWPQNNCHHCTTVSSKKISRLLWFSILATSVCTITTVTHSHHHHYPKTKNQQITHRRNFRTVNSLFVFFNVLGFIYLA